MNNFVKHIRKCNIYGNQKYESNIADLEQPNIIEMSVPFESESIKEDTTKSCVILN